MRGLGESGLHQPTYTEKMVTLLRLPYVLGSLLFAFLFSPVGALPFVLLETGDLNRAGSIVLAASSLESVENPLPLVVTYYALFYVVVFFLAYIVRYLRLRILQAEPALVTVLTEGEGTFHKAFHRTTSTWQPALLGLVFLAGSLFSPIFTSIYSALGPVSRADFVVVFAVVSFMLTNFVWVYFSSIWGVRQIGRSSLRLKTFREDRTLGAGPMGSLSLFLAFGYFGGLALLLLLSLISPVPGFRSLNLLGGFVGALALGMALFFVPLSSVHGKMLEEKQREQKLHLEEYNRLLQSFKEGGNPPERRGEGRLDALLLHEITGRRIAAIPTWPFDTGIIGRLAAILLSVSAILISKFVQIAFHIG
ncbi:MAG: hypothetical protein HY296_06260 [Thaumarchaeota archaeon]|nr:hypothetical protein [Nitrososphaerota archaeon]